MIRPCYRLGYCGNDASYECRRGPRRRWVPICRGCLQMLVTTWQASGFFTGPFVRPIP